MFGWINVFEVIFESRESGGKTDFEGHFLFVMDFPCGSVGKESACNAGDLGSIPGLRRSPGGGQGNPLQCSCLENPTDRGAWWATVHRVAKCRTRLSNFTLPKKRYSL